MGQLLLVRHGQASWDAEDYDVLSETGLGAVARARRLAGGARHLAVDARSCAAACAATGRPPRRAWASWAPRSSPEVDPGWDEFDHVSMLATLPAPFEGRSPSKAEFQEWFEEATDRWTGGEHDDDYAEPFEAFTARVEQALRRRPTDRVGHRPRVHQRRPDRVGVRVAARRRPDVRTALWHRLNPVCVNSGVTRVVTGRRGLTLVTFNDHGHLDPTPTC